MKKVQIFLVLFFLISVEFKSWSQDNSPGLLKVIPPSPNVASLGKYGEIPVSLYTGVPNISVPLYEITDGTLQLPIALSYHAGGLRVEEIASCVGLGWTLNAGGIVMRQVRGQADENFGWVQQNPANTVEAIVATGVENQIKQLAMDIETGQKDGEADLYSYNIGQISGKFFFDQAGEVHTQTSKNILISTIVGGWKIVAENGTAYSFAKSEEVNVASGSYDNIVTTAWYVTSIKSSDGKREITFTYEPIQYTYTTLGGEVKYHSTNGVGSTCLSNVPPSLTTNHYNTQRLSRIDFNEGYIRFNYNNIRCDLVDDKSLDEIEIYSIGNELIRKYAMTYSYFGPTSEECIRPNEINKRLKLIAVTEKTLSAEIPPYRFEYNETVQLPNRLSYAQDHWGYFNGKMNNQGLVATWTYANPYLDYQMSIIKGANREANPATSQAGILNKITYPTGGETIFTYENNTVSDNQTIYDVNPQYLTITGSNESPYSWANGVFESSSSLAIPTGGADVTFLSVSGLSMSQENWNDCDAVQCQIIKDNNPTPFRIIGDGWTGVQENWPAGTYKIRITSSCVLDSRASFMVNMVADIPVSSTLSTRPVGGVRIKEIENRPTTTDPPIIKKYHYTQEGFPELSSGALVNYPNYWYYLSAVNIGGLPGIQCNYIVRNSFSNYPCATTQGSYIGYSHVIVEQPGNGELRNSFFMFADNPPGFPFPHEERFDWRRGVLQNSKDYALTNGKLVPVKEVIYEYDWMNSAIVKGMKTGRENIMLTGGLPIINNFPAYAVYSTVAEFYDLSKITERLYDQKNTNQYVETVTKFTYSPQHLQLVETVSATTKTDNNTQEEMVMRKKYPTDYVFTSDPVGLDASGIKKLQVLHMVNTVVEEYVIKQTKNLQNSQLSNQRIISGTISIYKDDFPYLSKVLKLQTRVPFGLSTFGDGSILTANNFVYNNNSGIASAFRPAVFFDSYDERSNLTMQHQANDVVKSYVWGYNRNRPVAEILGSDISTVTGLINMNIINNPQISDMDMRAELDKIRIGLANTATRVNTYTYRMLKGMTSQTDPRGRKTYYEYDDFSRLKLLRDNDGNIIKTFEYHYRQP